MLDALRTFLDWYVTPWRRIDRTGFGIALLIVSLPSLIMAFAMARNVGGYVGPMLDILFALKGLGAGGDVGGALDTMNNAMGALERREKTAYFDWLGLVNNLLLLGLFPLCRMRLRDMGQTGRQELGWALAMNLSVVNGLIYNVLGVYVLPLGWVWTLLNFGGYMWLSAAKGTPRLAVNERMNYTTAERKQDDE